MNYVQLEAAVATLTSTINRDLGREAIKPMTLETPQPPPDELHFFRLVVWCYGFVFEAAADVLKECKSLMKQNAPERTNRYDLVSRTVNNLRTYKVHNLPPSKSNDQKRAQAEAWLAEFKHGGDGMARASEQLCKMTLEVLNDITSLWTAATADPGDALQLIEQVLNSLDNAWPPHEFHRIAEEEAKNIQLHGFNAKNFCEKYLAEWRAIGACFLDRKSGEAGIRRAIQTTMYATFGKVS